jgi:hypothetical protein
MERSGRNPVWESLSVDPIRAHWLILLLAIDVLYGGSNLLGHGLAFWCGLALIGLAVVIGLGWNITGAAFATIAWSALMFAGTDSTILLGGLAGFHILVIYDVGTGLDAAREAKQRS